MAATDALVHPQDDRERDLLDGDGVADFAGGFAAAAAELGASPALYHLDTSRTEKPVARTMSEEIARIVRGRLTNPRWIKGMIGHGHRGVAEMAQAVDALYAFAATAAGVPGHLFDAVHDALIAMRAIIDAAIIANAPAAATMAEHLEDAIARGLWTPRRNAVHGELARVRDAALLHRLPSGADRRNQHRPQPARGWCPGALRPMQSGDGLIVRVRPRRACAAAERAEAIAAMAKRTVTGSST